LNVLVADLGPSSLAPGDVFNFTFTGGTPNGCYRIVEKTVATPTDGATPLLFYVNCAACEATLVTPTPTTTSTPTPSVTNTQTSSVTPTQTPTNTETPTQTPTVTQLYYYYNLLNCNLANNSVGRSTEPLTGVTYNVDVNLCYTIVGIDLGPLYDYDLDVATSVTDCSDVLCGLPTPTLTPTTSITPTNSVTPTNTVTTTPSVTPTTSVTPTVTPSITPTNSPSVTPTNTTTPTETPTNTPTPTPTPTTAPSGGWFFYSPDNQPVPVGPTNNGDTTFTSGTAPAIGTYNPNYTGGTFNLYFNNNNSVGTSYLSQFSGLNTTGGTITISQGSSTAIYSGTSSQYDMPGPGTFLQLTVTGSTQMIQSASTAFVSGTTINVVTS
jgi:hypothetical protein